MRFSVLLPTRNGGAFLENCIRSILDQEFEDFELVISDNANCDETPRIIDSFASNSHVKVLRLESPVPVTDNWNNALRAASGDYLLMMGDDDYLLPGYLRRMSEVIEKYGNPDCVLYNAHSYVAPGSISDNEGSYFNENHFSFDSKFSTEGRIPLALRSEIVRDMFRFRVRIPLNMQTTLVSRRAAERIPGGMFRAPFPDHFALNSLLLKAENWVMVPEHLLVVGVSPKSFGHYVYSNQQSAGLVYLGINSDFPGRLPGNELVNGMHGWLTLLKQSYPSELGDIGIDRSGYVRRQLYTWLMQIRAGAISLRELVGLSALLSAKDWGGLLATPFDLASWRRFGKLLASIGKSEVETQWHGLQPLDGVKDIRDFASWLVRRQGNRK